MQAQVNSHQVHTHIMQCANKIKGERAMNEEEEEEGGLEPKCSENYQVQPPARS